MCRWLAYRGPEIYLDTLLFKPQHSLVNQSWDAHRSQMRANADGFGVAWYGERSWPGLYRDIRPAWNDDNLLRVTQQIRSGLFLAHVRASTGTVVQRTNCHPFRCGPWVFQHNGLIRSFPQVRRDLDSLVAPELYPQMDGSTDSERMFFLALTLGLDLDVPGALSRMVGLVEEVGRRAGEEHPVEMTVATTDGQRIWAVRYASDGESRSLFYSRNVRALKEIEDPREELPGEGTVVLSEPLDDVSANWKEVPEGSLLVVDEDGSVEISDFVPQAVETVEV